MLNACKQGRQSSAAPGYFSPGYPDTALAEVARPGCTSARYRRLVLLPLRMELWQQGGSHQYGHTRCAVACLHQVGCIAAGWSAGLCDQPRHKHETRGDGSKGKT